MPPIYDILTGGVLGAGGVFLADVLPGVPTIDVPPVLIGKGAGERASIAEALRLEKSAKLAAGAAEAAAEAARTTTEVVDVWVSQLAETAQAAREAAPEAAKRAALGPLLLLKEDPLAPIIPEWDPLGAIPIWLPLLAGAFILAR